MSWADTSAGVMKMRNGANSAWISLYQLDGEWTSIAFENGTAAATSIYFKDSGTDTGIYSPGTDQVAISTGGTGRLFVSASGQVGIGTSPSFPLDVNGTIYTRGRGSTFGILFDDYRIYNSTSPGALVFDNGSPRLTITSAGLVGIGTTGPAAKLDIYKGAGSSYADALILTNDSASGANQGIAFGSTVNISCRIKALDDGAYGTHLIFEGRTGSGPLTTTTERARIDSSGRLLVGGSPDSGGALLQVFGDRIRIGTAKTPASATATGTAGEICWDANYIYVCTATNTWKRTAISTW